MMTNYDLQKILGDRIAVTLSDLSLEQRMLENERTGLILGLSKQMIQNGNLMLNADRTYGNQNGKASRVKETILGKEEPGWMTK